MTVVFSVDLRQGFCDRLYGNIQKSFNSTPKRAGIKNFRSHDLRHTFTSQLAMTGIDITTVKELLDHKTLTMTLRYAHLAPSHKVSALDMLDSALTSTVVKNNQFSNCGAINKVSKWGNETPWRASPTIIYLHDETCSKIECISLNLPLLEYPQPETHRLKSNLTWVSPSFNKPASR